MNHMQSRILGAFAAIFLLAVSVQSASAGQILNFSYTDLENDTVAGTMNGSLQSDNNTFLVTSMGPLTFDGVLAPVPLVFIESADVFASVGTGFDGLGLAAVTLDASYMDFIACDVSACSNDGLALVVGDVFTNVLSGGKSEYSAVGEFGGASGPVTEAVNAAGWSASLAASAPEPGSLVLVSIALLAAAVRKRNAIISAIQAAC